MDQPASSRVCGECIACCVYLRINAPALKKQGMEHCPHLRLSEPVRPDVAQYSTDEPQPCRIYENRPEVCGGYSCLWRLGHGADDDRPDRSGMLCDTLHSIEGAAECKPLGPDFENQERAVGAILRICRSTGRVGMVTNFYERRFVRVVGRPL